MSTEALRSNSKVKFDQDLEKLKKGDSVSGRDRADKIEQAAKKITVWIIKSSIKIERECFLTWINMEIMT